MLSKIANLMTLGGVFVAILAVGFRYLIPVWPAEGVNLSVVDLRLAVFQYLGVALAIIGGCFIAWKTAGARRIRISFLLIAVAVLTVVSAIKGNFETNRFSVVSTRPEPGKYHYSEDWMSDDTELWAHVLAPVKGKAGIRALEVGTFEGRSALWFLENILTDPTSTITCVDIWVGPYEKTFDENIKAYDHPGKVIKIKNRSDEALRKLSPKSFDFIYIDGSHEAKDVLVDAVMAWDLLKLGGLIIFDDYNWYGPRSWLVANFTPKIAIDAFLEIFKPYVELVYKDYQVVVRKKLDTEHVDLETHKMLRSFMLGLQRALG
jgi:hypothetical protein